MNVKGVARSSIESPLIFLIISSVPQNAMVRGVVKTGERRIIPLGREVN